MGIHRRSQGSSCDRPCRAVQQESESAGLCVSRRDPSQRSRPDAINALVRYNSIFWYAELAGGIILFIAGFWITVYGYRKASKTTDKNEGEFLSMLFVVGIGIAVFALCVIVVDSINLLNPVGASLSGLTHK